jgi:acyl-CoA synthetase (AMP-forming)/AMP-acid ligase II
MKKALAQDRCNFFYVLEDAANAVPNRVYLVYQGKEWSYKEFKLQAQRFGNYFLSLGVKPRGMSSNITVIDVVADHVAMDFTNKPEFLFVMLGLLAIGAVPVLINFNLTSKPLLHCITVADSKLFIFDCEIASNVEGIKESLTQAGIRSICLLDDDTPTPPENTTWTECVSTQHVSTQCSAERPPDSMRSGAKLIDMEMLMFTSGTTGLPKPAIISYNKLGGAPILFYRWAGITSSDRFYSCMPLYHATALLLAAAMMIRAQGTFILGHKFGLQTFWEEVRESKATCIQYVGEMCRYLLSAPPSERDKNHCVKIALGNGMRPEVWNRFRDRFGIDTIAELYAATGLIHPLKLTDG